MSVILDGVQELHFFAETVWSFNMEKCKDVLTALAGKVVKVRLKYEVS